MVFFPYVVAAQNDEVFKYIKRGSIEKLKLNLNSQAIDLEQRNLIGDTPVIVAARNGNLDILRLLVKHGANINALDRKKRDVLNIAITSRNPELARTALQLGADPTMVTSVYKGGAIIYGSAKGAVEIVDMLIKAGAPVNRVNRLGWSALLEVAILGDGSQAYVTIAGMLIKAGGDKTIRDRDGQTPYDHAKSRGYSQLAEVLKF